MGYRGYLRVQTDMGKQLGGRRFNNDRFSSGSRKILWLHDSALSPARRAAIATHGSARIPEGAVAFSTLDSRHRVSDRRHVGRRGDGLRPRGSHRARRCQSRHRLPRRRWLSRGSDCALRASPRPSRGAPARPRGRGARLGERRLRPGVQGKQEEEDQGRQRGAGAEAEIETGGAQG